MSWLAGSGFSCPSFRKLVTRSRPDVLFVTSMMASALSRRPCHVYRVGLKVMAYLASTLEVQLQLGGHELPPEHEQPKQAAPAASQQTTTHRPPAALQHSQGLGLTGYSDASFAPFGGRSYGASTIALNGSVVSWRCGRQAFTTMSVAEAELYEAAQAHSTVTRNRSLGTGDYRHPGGAITASGQCSSSVLDFWVSGLMENETFEGEVLVSVRCVQRAYRHSSTSNSSTL